MARKKIIDKIGGFDTRFFMYGEDIDLSYMIKLSGYKNYYLSQTSIIHFKGESTKKSSAYTKIFYHAMHLFVNKHFKGISKIPMHFAIKTGKIFSNLKFKINETKDPKNPSIINLAVIANPESFNEIEKLLIYSKEKINTEYRLAAGSKAVEVNELLSGLKPNSVSHILFSEGNLSFKKIINFIEENNDSYKFLFHAYQSCSIVWSNDKNEKGNFISYDLVSQKDQL